MPSRGSSYSLSFKVFIYVLIAVIIIFAGISVLISWREEREITKKYQSLLRGDVSLFIQELRLVHRSNERALDGFYALMQKLINGKDPFSRANQIVKSFKKYSKDGVAIIYSYKNGQFKALASSEEGLILPITPGTGVYEGLTEGEVKEELIFQNGKLILGRFIPIGEKGGLKGAIFVGLDMTSLIQNFATNLKRVKVGKTGYIYVMDLSSKKFVYHPRRTGQNIYQLKDITGRSILKRMLEKMIEKKKGVMTYTVNVNGTPQTFLTAFEYFPPYRWLVVAAVNHSEISQAVNRLRLVLSVLNLLAALLVGGVVFFVTKNSLKSIPLIAQTLEKLADGDLTHEFAFSEKDRSRKDEIGMLINSILKLDSFIKSSFNEIKSSIDAVKSVITALEENIVNVKQKADTQDALTNQLAAASEEMTATIADIAKNATTSAELATQSAKVAEEGREKADRAEQTIYTTNQATQELKHTIDALSGSVEEIGSIVGLIKDIADQINLLALNATIEAARAGEHGKGFAVVAEEIRKLAERTIRSSNEIAQKISAVQEVSKETLTQMDITAKEVEGAIEALKSVKDSLVKIVEHSNQVKDAISHIAAATEEQSITSEEINKHIEQAAKLAVEIKETTFDVDKAVKSLQDVVKQLALTVERVKL